MSSPLDFVTNFLKQPYPTMGLAPSAVITKTGTTAVQNGTGASRIGQSGQTMWARIAAAVPFGWALGNVATAVVGQGNVDLAQAKVIQGAQAVNGKVDNALSGIFSWTKWILIGAVIVAVVFFLAQIKSLFRN